MESNLQNLAEGLERVLRSLVQILNRRRIRYALVGGIATGLMGRPRATRDIDLVLQISQIELPGLLDELAEQGFSIDTEAVIREWVQNHMTAIQCGGWRIDWLKPVIPLYQHVIDRAKPRDFGGTPLLVAAAENLILTKLVAFRTQDRVDVETLLAANQGQLDIDYIRSEWQTVADLGDPRWREFEQMVREFYEPGRD